MAIKEKIENVFYRYKSGADEYTRFAFWTKSSQVENDNGMNLQDTIGNITGISDSINTRNSTICASSTAILNLKEDLTFSVQGRLNVGATTLNISNTRIKTTSFIDIYTDVWGVAPNSVSVDNGIIKMTFTAQNQVVNVRVKITN